MEKQNNKPLKKKANSEIKIGTKAFKSFYKEVLWWTDGPITMNDFKKNNYEVNYNDKSSSS